MDGKQQTLFSELPPEQQHPCDHCEEMTDESELQYVNDEWVCEECKCRAKEEQAGEEWKGEADPDEDDESI